MEKIFSYVLITAARNEVKLIEQTINSVIGQTVKPLKWVIVSDGSTDGTDEVARRYAAHHPWIEVLSLPKRAQRHFAGKVAALNAGEAKLVNLDYEVIGNLDADVTFESDYLEFLVRKFGDDPKLGVAGTPYLEENQAQDERFKSPDHVSGACQLFRRRCWEEIGGYPPLKAGGVDLIAVLAAQAKGWRTQRFENKTCFHHRNVGSGQHARILSRMLNLGKKDYLLGSHPGFEFFRCVLWMKSPPYVIGGCLMILGYFWAMVRGLERSMPEDLIKIRQSDQIQRLLQLFRHPLKNSHPRSAAQARP
jgi:glycosyltransferase involved in cell wall biosynthesis